MNDNNLIIIVIGEKDGEQDVSITKVLESAELEQISKFISEKLNAVENGRCIICKTLLTFDGTNKAVREEGCAEPEKKEAEDKDAREGRSSLTIRQIDDMVAHYNTGMSIPKIAEWFGISPITVCYHLKKRGAIKFMPSQEKLDELKRKVNKDPVKRGRFYINQIDQMIEMQKQGMADEEIAAWFNVSVNSIKKVLQSETS